MPDCPICDSELVETNVTTLQCPTPGKHAGGAPKIGSAMLDCPVKKGAIWVYVCDDYKGLKEIPVTVSGSKPTDSTGFAFFDPLAPGNDYTVEIDISSVKDDYYPPAKTKIGKVPVRNGEITSVEFKLTVFTLHLFQFQADILEAFLQACRSIH